MWTERLTIRIRGPSKLEPVIGSKVRLGSDVNSRVMGGGLSLDLGISLQS